jgi:hypothetical protein
LQPINLDEIIVEIMVLVKLFIKNDNSNSKKDRNKEIEG